MAHTRKLTPQLKGYSRKG